MEILKILKERSFVNQDKQMLFPVTGISLHFCASGDPTQGLRWKNH
jgi:hypothetical protein